MPVLSEEFSTFTWQEPEVVYDSEDRAIRASAIGTGATRGTLSTEPCLVLLGYAGMDAFAGPSFGTGYPDLANDAMFDGYTEMRLSLGFGLYFPLPSPVMHRDPCSPTTAIYPPSITVEIIEDVGGGVAVSNEFEPREYIVQDGIVVANDASSTNMGTVFAPERWSTFTLVGSGFYHGVIIQAFVNIYARYIDPFPPFEEPEEPDPPTQLPPYPQCNDIPPVPAIVNVGDLIAGIVPLRRRRSP